MPQTYVNVFSPQTPWGTSLQNIAQAMFSGPTPVEMERQAAQTRAYDAHARTYGAQADKYAAEAEEIRNRQQRAGQLPMDVATAVFGNAQRGRQFLDYRQHGDWGVQPQDPDLVGPPVPNAQPEWATNESIGRANSMMLAPTMVAAAGRGNAPGALDDVMGALFRDEFQRAAMAGRTTQQQAGAVGMATAGAAGRPIYDALPGGIGSMNVFTGANGLNELGSAKVSTERSVQAENYAQGRQADAGARENDAQAGFHNARSDLIRNTGTLTGNRTGGGGGAGNKPILSFKGFDGNGNPIYEAVPNVVGQEVVKPTTVKPPTARELQTAFDNVLVGLGVPTGQVAPAVRGEIMERLNAGESAFQITTDIRSRLKAPGWFGQYEVAPRAPSVAVPPQVGARLAPQGRVALPAPSTPQGPGTTYTAPNGRTVTQQEIDATAARRGKTPQQVIQDLGLRPNA